jgi:hypothetical protein
MLLFRGTSWHQGLSSETVQAVMNQWYDWFDSLQPLHVFIINDLR